MTCEIPVVKLWNGFVILQLTFGIWYGKKLGLGDFSQIYIIYVYIPFHVDLTLTWQRYVKAYHWIGFTVIKTCKENLNVGSIFLIWTNINPSMDRIPSNYQKHLSSWSQQNYNIRPNDKETPVQSAPKGSHLNKRHLVSLANYRVLVSVRVCEWG